MVKINDIEIKQKQFVFDGCHKIYLVDESDLADCESKGYDLKKDLFPIDQIAKVFWNTCSLRFIETWKDYKHIVPQCEEFVMFEINGEKILEDFGKDEVTKEVV